MKPPKYKLTVTGCGKCICRDCLMWWSGRCPHGGCYDDYRAAFEPYNMWHPEVRKWWSNWSLPGEQAHWCRGGVFYSADHCEYYVKYTGHSDVKTCLEQNVQAFQDGYILCGLVETWGCEECYRRFMEKRKEMTLKCDREIQAEFERKLNSVMPALCLTLHREYNWGREHCKEFLNGYQRTWEEIAKDNTLSSLALVEKETGIELRNEDGISYHDLDYLNDRPIRPLTMGQYLCMRARQMRWIETAMIGVAFITLHRREGWGYTRLTRFLEQYYETRDAYGKRSKDLLKDCREEVGLNLVKGLPV